MRNNYVELTDGIQLLFVRQKKLWLRYWRHLLFLPFLLLMFCLNNPVYSQQLIDTETTVKADFGIDGDVWEDILSFYPSSPAPEVGTDDWFVTPPDGNTATGAGVIDVTSAEAVAEIAKISAGQNVGIELRMSAPVYTAPDNNGTWVDAAYIRDQNIAGGNQDITVFDQKINKNFDDPRSWGFKEGDVPGKTDIIDVYGHIRRLPLTPPADDEFAIFGASTADADGSNHLDFEYFRKRVDFVDNKIVYEDENDGGDCGHTAYSFYPDGSVEIHGDVALSVDYVNGGVNAEVSMFAWIDKRDFPDDADLEAFNLLPGRPFEFVIANDAFYACTNSFDEDPEDDNFGYHMIQLRGDLPEDAVFTQLNDAGPVDAPPWGTIDSKGKRVEEYATNTLVEFAVNATALGFDTRSGDDPCVSTLGSVIVKSRSSASFPSSLKDMGGPFDLGDKPQLEVFLTGGEACQYDPSVPLEADLGISPPADTPSVVYNYIWEKQVSPGFWTVVAEHTKTYNAPADVVGDFYYKVTVEATNGGVEGCTKTSDSVLVRIHENPTCYVEVTDETHRLAGDGTAAVVPSLGTPPYSYVWSSKIQGTLTDSISFDSMITGLSEGIYYVTVTDDNGCKTSCNDTIEWTPTAPTCDVYATHIECYGADDGMAVAVIDTLQNGYWPPYTVVWEADLTNPPDGIFETSIITHTDVYSVFDTIGNVIGLQPGVYRATINDAWDPATTACLDTVTETPEIPIVVDCSDLIVDPCLDQSEINTAFSNWLDTTFHVTGGTVVLSDGTPVIEFRDTIYRIDGVVDDIGNAVAPAVCGDSIRIEMVVTDYCGVKDSCEALFGVPALNDLVVTDPADDMDNSSCDYDNQTQLSAAFDSWMAASLLAIETEIGNQGCDPQVDDDWDKVYPMLCEGDTILVTWTITDLCDTTTASASFGVSGVDDLVVTDPADDMDNSSCDYDNQTQLSAAFDSWMAASLLSIETEIGNQGCDPQVDDDWDKVYPMLCEGDTILVTWTITDLCDTTTASASFGVSGVDDLVVTDPADDMDNSSCDYDNQTQLSAAFDSWMVASLLAIETEIGNQGCDPQVDDDWDKVYPMLCEGDTILVTWTITDLCDTTTASASFGVSGVDDLVVTDPADDMDNSSCDYDNQTQLSAAFDSWMAASLLSIETEIGNQGCDPQVDDDWDKVYPMLCEGDTILVTWTITDLCDTTTASASFGVSGVDDLVVTDPADDMDNSSCDYDNQTQLSAAFDSWMAASLLAIETEIGNQGCDPQVDDDWDKVYPMLCEGDTILVTWTITDLCDTTTASASFGVSGVDDLVVTDPADDMDNSSCDYDNQTQLSAAFDSWMAASLLAIETEIGNQGCDPQVDDDWDKVYPVLCEGDTILVTWTITDLCDTTTASASFGVSGVDDLVVTDPADDMDNSSCDYDNQTQLSAAFDSWMAASLLAIETEIGNQGCDPQVDDDWDKVYPMLCEGDTILVTWTITDLCDTTTASASFGVSGVDDLVVTDPADDKDNSSCDYDNQTQLSAAFDSWMAASLLAIETEIGNQGCDPQVDDDWDKVYPMLCEGDTILVTWTITDLCDTTTVSASFGTSARDAIIVHCNNTLLTCNDVDIQGAYDAWVNGFTYEGGCEGMVLDNIGDVPLLSEINLATGGTLTFKYYAYDNCTSDTVTCTFTVPDCGECNTAYAYGEDDISHSFLSSCGGPVSEWGWSIEIPEPGIYKFAVYAGAPTCDPSPVWDSHLVDSVLVTYDGTYLTVDYLELYPEFSLDQTHIWVGTSMFPEKIAPGQWKNYEGDMILFGGGYVVIHAVYCGPKLPTVTEEKAAELETTIPGLLAPSELKVFPNPFNDKVTFEFVSGEDGHAVLELYNITGQRVVRLMDRYVYNGVMNRVDYVPTDAVSGIYIYKLTQNGNNQIGRVIYQKQRP